MAGSDENGGIYVFDAYGTLFDVHSAAARLSGEIGPAWERLSEIWRTKQLEYTWVMSAIGTQATFWRLTEQALDYAIAASGAGIGNGLRARLLDAYRTLDAYAEVKGVLTRLRDDGARLAILSNGDSDLLERAVMSSGLDGIFVHVLSVADAGTFKPHGMVYRLAVEAFDAPPEAITFCSSNRWDVAGAAAFGFEAVWINRLARPQEYPEHPPARVMATLEGLLVA